MSKGIAGLVALLALVVAAVLWRQAGAPELVASDTPRADGVEFLASARAPGSAEVGAASEPSRPAECTTTLRARVVDPDGSAIAGATVEIDFPPASARSDSDGDVEIVLDLVRRGGPRSVRLRAAAAGRAQLVRSLSLEEDATFDAGELVLAPGASVRGRVLDAEGRACAGAEVRASSDVETYEAWKLRGPTQCEAETESGADGRFVLEGVPLGAARIWAGAPSTFWSSSRVLDVGPQADEDVVLRLHRIPPQDVIAVRVAAPDGTPVAGAQIELRATAKGSTVELDATADEDGSFTHVAELRCPHEVRARDPRGRFRDATASVEPGGPPLELVLGEARALRIAVRDTQGAPLERFRARLLARDGAELAATASDAHPGGVATLALPSRSFFVEVSAEGWTVPEPAREIDPDAAGSEIAVVLAPRTALRGVVRAGDEPVAGASLWLRPVGGGGKLSLARSDGSGAFVLASDADGPVVLRAEAEGYAPAEIGPLEGGRALEGLELELVRGGAAEGVLLVDPGVSPAGRAIVASRGDGHDLSARVADDGRFRLEGLTPGAWTITSEGAARSAEIEVRDGATTAVEVSCRTQPAVRVRGRLSFPGAATDGLRATLIAGGREIASSDLDAGGRFELAAARAGEHVLRLESTRAGEDLRIDAALSLRDGDNAWELDLPLGRAQGRVVHAVPKSAVLAWRWTRGASLSAVGTVRADASGTFVVPRMPAGTITFVRSDGAAEERMTEIELPESATIDVEL